MINGEVLTSVAESLEWIAEPDNPTEITEGQNVALTWSYSLTAGEQASSITPGYIVKWFKFNSSSLVHIEIASYSIIGDGQFFGKPKDPRYVVGTPIASDSATLLINDVTRSDEARYKIEYRLISTGKLNESEINLTVLGVFSFYMYIMIIINVCLHLQCSTYMNLLL